MPDIGEIVKLFENRGDSQYGGEAVTQLEHALQAASFAEQEHAPAELLVAALLHDFGHLLHDLPNDAPDSGVDDGHENSAASYLRNLFPASVTEPIRLHVAAKRYLCTVDPHYLEALSPASMVSLRLQGGQMTLDEAAEFEKHPHAADAVRLRQWDDAAKDPLQTTPPISHYAPYLHTVAVRKSSA